VISFTLISSAFKEGETIPERYTCGGTDVSPPLHWSIPPAGTRSYAIIADDPDAPVGIWVHWVIYNLPLDLRGLSAISNVSAMEGPARRRESLTAISSSCTPWTRCLI